MHVLQREGPAIGAFDDPNDFFHRCNFKPQYVVDENRAIHIRRAKPIRGGVKFGVDVAFAHAKRVKVGCQVAANTIGADQHQCANTV